MLRLLVVDCAGLASAVYQFGILDWTTATALEKDGSGGISWLLPCSTAFLLIGLALDYDIFLFSRVYELRKTKLQTVPAIVEAVRVTGPVISGAGIIMALAFLGMLFNSNKFLNEVGTQCAAAASLSSVVCVIISCLLAPSLHSMVWYGMIVVEFPTFISSMAACVLFVHQTVRVHHDHRRSCRHVRRANNSCSSGVVNRRCSELVADENARPLSLHFGVSRRRRCEDQVEARMALTDCLL